MTRISLLAVILGGAATGCGSTRMTDTQRAGSEMRLVSQAIDRAVTQLDFAELQGKTVFLDTQYLDGTVDKGYLISSIRQQLLAHGALLQEERLKATYVVEPRSGGVGTDKHTLLVGIPATSLPALVPGVPSAIPEIALVKKSDQQGIAKIAVFAYNRTSGRALWQSDLVEASSNLKDTWYFGAGPYRRGSIMRDSEFAGEALPRIPAALHVFPEEVTPKATEIKPEKGTAHVGGDAPPAAGFGTSLFGHDRHWFGPTHPTVATPPEPAAPNPLPPQIAGPPPAPATIPVQR